jgi:hypothetical protein
MENSMSNTKPVAETISTILACSCHKNDTGCCGTFILNFPIPMFLPSGSLEYRMHRSEFLKGLAAVYDELAESARQELNRRDPQTIRPKLEALPIAVFELTDVQKAQVPWGELKDEPEGGH